MPVQNARAGTSVTENTAEVGFTRNDGMSDLLTKDGGWQTVVFKTVYSVHSVRYSASWKYAVVALVFPYLVLVEFFGLNNFLGVSGVSRVGMFWNLRAREKTTRSRGSGRGST